MERRAFARQLLFLPAQLVRTGVGAVPCTIQNFCLGGVFLGLEGTAPVEVDDSVQVHFSTSLDGDNRDFRLRARVVAEVGGGIGCEFFDPDQEAILALQTLADRPQEQPTPAPTAPTPTPTPPPSNAAPLIARCKELLSNYLSPWVHTLFERAEENLFLSARDASSNAQQNLYLDTQKDVERLKQPVQQGFVEVVTVQMDHLGAPLTAMQEPEDDQSSGGLSLVESGEFADWLAVKQIFSRAEPTLREEQYKIEKRLGALSGVNIEEDNNPVGLAVLCHTFHDALQTISTPRLARRVVFEAFDEIVVTDLKELYDGLNEFLETSGVLVDIEIPAPVIAKIQEGSGDPAPSDRLSGDREWMEDANRHPSGEAETPQPNAFASEPPSRGMAPAISTHGAPAHNRGPDQPASAPTPAAGVPMTTASPGGEASPGSVGLSPGTGPLADEMAPHPSVAGGVPFDAHRVIRGNVFSAPMDITHSAYQTAQALMSLNRQIQPADPEAVPLPSYESDQVKGALALLQKQEASQPVSGQGGPDLKTRVIRALRSRHGYAEKKDIPEQEGAAIDLISQLVESVVADVLVTDDLKPQLRRLEVPLLNVAMQDPEFFATPNHPARQMVNRLAQVTGAKDGTVAAGVARNVDSVMERIVNHSAEDPDVFTESVRKLDTVITQQNVSRQSNMKEVVRSCEEQQALVKSRGGSPAAVKPDERELPEEWRQWLSRAKRLQVGDAVMLDKKSDNPQRGTLAWVGEDHATYVFVDNQGLKASTMSLNELAMQLRRGEADVIPETDLPAMDRGLYSMLRTMHEEVLKQAGRDELTELLNQREFDSRLDAAAAEARRDHTNHALCLMDLDHFHVINETCGRKAGDRLLKEVGKVLQKTMGGTGELARLGEDKFGVLFTDTSEDRSFEVVEKQRAAIEKFRVTWKGERLPLTMSVGLTEVTSDNEGGRPILDGATIAKERAKTAGGNRIDVYRPADETTGLRRGEAEWVSRIEQTLEKNRLVLRCQKFSPVSEDNPDKPHYEVLLGVMDENNELTLPGEFIQAAEIHDKIIDVDRWVIATAFTWMADNKRKLARMGGVSIKLSEKSVSEEDTLVYVLEQFSQSKLPPRKVIFEVTENAALASLSNAENFIRVLGEYGCRFLLDDFGSGQSSYAYLKHLPFDFVKIDGMFVRNIAESSGDHAMVKSMNEIGHFMGKKTIAEFVENQPILDALREIGIDYAQGFAIEEPMRLTDLT